MLFLIVSTVLRTFSVCVFPGAGKTPSRSRTNTRSPRRLHGGRLSSRRRVQVSLAEAVRAMPPKWGRRIRVAVTDEIPGVTNYTLRSPLSQRECP